MDNNMDTETETEYVVCAECEHEYASEFDEDTGYATTDCPVCGTDQREYPEYEDDMAADAEALASAGYGTDEDYGFAGDDGYDW